MSLDAARDKARIIIGRIKAGADRAGPEAFATVAADFVKRHLEANNIITKANKERYLRNHILPVWSGRDFRSIRRSDVAKLMDHVSDTAGPVAADEVLSIVRSICSWFATRNDDYVSPIIKGMRRTSTKERARDRVLTDEEIRTVWNAASGTFGGIVKLLLLTGQRRTTVASMRWDDVSVDGTWRCNEGPRQKGRGGELVLPPMAVEIIRQQPRFAHSLFVFPAARGSSHFRAYTDGKAAIGGDWRLHDLRRTARSLMSRAGVRPDVAERVLGHAMGGVEGIYDRHSYVTEKAHALKALAGLIDSILRPPSSNVVSLAK
jgi:integrase